MTETVTNFAEGLLKQTQGKWDMAIHGDGFFMVENDGQATADACRQLPGQRGGPADDAAGLSRVVGVRNTHSDRSSSMYSMLHKDGYLEHSGGGEWLALKKPQSLGDLARVGENLFRPLGPLDDVETSRAARRSPGFLEMSDVRPTRTMMELIETSRACTKPTSA